MEQWRKVPGYEGLYEVSNTGKIKSLERVDKTGHIHKERILRKQITKRGYERVVLCKDGKIKAYFVHRLVAFAFPEICGIYFDGAEVNHKNEIKTDNRPENLEWCNRHYNANYGTGNQRNAEHRINHPDISKQVQQYSLDGKFIAAYPSVSEAHRKTNISLSNISRCALGKRRTAGNKKDKYIWKYE